MCIEITKGSKQVQAELEAMLIRHEGYRRTPYQDSGYLSIGYGRNLNTNGISPKEALYLLRNDVSRITYELAKKYPVFDELTNARRAVLISMAYGLGMDGISQFTLMWSNLEKRDYNKAALEIYMSSYCTQIGSRCAELAEMMETGVYNA